MYKFNINHYVKVKLTELGKEIYFNKDEELKDDLEKRGVNASYIEKSYPEIDEDGYTEFQLYDFMNIYGKYLAVGMRGLPCETEILFYDKDLVRVNQAYLNV